MTPQTSTNKNRAIRNCTETSPQRAESWPATRLLALAFVPVHNAPNRIAPSRRHSYDWRMPARPKTSDDEIIAATRALLEARGRDGFTMAEIAEAVGVRTPSLFSRFASRAALLDRVELALWAALGEELAAAAGSARLRRKPLEALTAQGRAYRAFAKANPNGYALMFDPRASQTPAGAQIRAAALAPCLPAFTALVGEDKALAAARVLTPFLHGFVSMELSQAFRLGGGIDEAFETGLSSILGGLLSWR